MDRWALNEAFDAEFGGEPDLVVVAPGRINLIGEHTDYNEGFVFPVAIDRQLYVAARATGGPSRLLSVQLGAGEPFDPDTVEPSGVEGWVKYVAGMAWAFRGTGCHAPNVEAVVHSDIPIGSGVSSSAALELAFGVVYNELGGFGFENMSLAKLGQIDENRFVGVNSGIMDQAASAMGREGHAMFLDTRTLDIVHARIPDEMSIVLCDTKTPRSLTTSAYNERRSQCERASAILGVKALRDASLDSLNHHRTLMDEVEYRRARHVITENERAQRFVPALDDGDRDLIGSLMRSSHESLRDDYEVSSRELDIMAETCWAAEGCIGARMTGAGFGGACVALVENKKLEAFSDSVNLEYEAASGKDGEVLSCRPVDGARVLWRR